jgi:hypothetical protein
MAFNRRRDSELRDSVAGYVRRARVLRQIQSNKASRAHKWDIGYLIATVFLATLISVVGFAGTDRIAEILSPDDDAQKEALPIVEFAMSLSVLAILIVTLVGLVFRFGERANRHYRSLEVLTEFMRESTDIVKMHEAGIRRIRPATLDLVRTRYFGVISALPPSTDKEHDRARNDDQRKQARSSESKESRRRPLPRPPRSVQVFPRTVRSPSSQRDAKRITSLLWRDESRVVALAAVREILGSRAWITGGFIREAIWDATEGLPPEAPTDDVDVIYFSRRDLSKRAERVLQGRLDRGYPEFRWSVKNQARMHLINGDSAYSSMEDAVSKYPETASAIAVQLARNGIRFMAPLGFEDLRRMKLRRNPIGSAAAYERRYPQVESGGRWSMLSSEPPTSLLKATIEAPLPAG